MKKAFLSLSAALLLSALAAFSASAQDKSFGSRLGLSWEIMAEGFAKDFFNEFH